MKRLELGGPVDPRDREGQDDAVIVCHLVSVRSPSSSRSPPCRPPAGCLRLGRLDLAHRPVVEGEAVLATLRSAEGTMWRNS